MHKLRLKLKASKMLLGIMLLLFILVTGCSDLKSYDGGVTLTIPDEIKNYMNYIGELPSRHFDYDGPVKVAKSSSSNYYIFGGNDQYVFSEKFGEHLEKYMGNSIITENTPAYDEKEGKTNFAGKTVPIDSPSEEIMMVTWDETGTRYSYQYRTFVSNGKRYYAFWYTTNIIISMELPLMVKKVDNQNRLFLLSLPYDTKYDVSPALELKKLVKKDTYLDESYYIFQYPNYLTLTLKCQNEEERQNAIKDWYRTYCFGHEENGKFVFTYLGINYELSFGVYKQGNPGFKLSII